MNILPQFRTAGIRDNGTSTEPAEHLSRSAADAALDAHRAAGRVPQFWTGAPGRWIPERAERQAPPVHTLRIIRRSA